VSPDNHRTIPCWKCGKTGHQKKDCPQKGQHSSNEKGAKKCGRCGKPGHETARCWKDPKNADKRPAWLKEKLQGSGREVSAVNATFEVLCCSVCNGGFGNAEPPEDVLLEEDRVHIVAPDIVITELREETEVCMEMSDTQLFPKALKLLSDPNIWIGDTGASVDMTPAAVPFFVL
jgi:Zinc knuckle